MSLDENLLSALAETIAELQEAEPRPIPANVIASLAPIARAGMQLKIDLVASRRIGAPLISMQNSVSAPDLTPLTPRQKDVARLIIKGLSNKQIASQLNISPATVKDHVHAILTRLKLPSRTALIANATRDTA